MRLLPMTALALALIACGTGTNATDNASTSANPTAYRVTNESSARIVATNDEPDVSEFVINSDEINESSGLARSHRRPDLLWTHNDSGGETAVYALTTTGSLVASVRLNGLGIVNLDWEDMTSFTLDGKPYLLVGDIGDNNAFRPTLTYYLLEEPEIDPNAPGPQRLVADVLATYTVRLPDAPRDIESLAVDGQTQTAYMISKRDAEPMLYSFSLARPLPTMLQAPVVASNLGKINIPRAPADYSMAPETFNWVTTMDFSENGLAAYVGTLSQGYRYVRRPDQSWQDAFASPPQAISLPAYSQIEAGAFAFGRDDSVFITSENLPGRLARLRFH